MSDISTLAGLQFNQRDIIESVIGQTFFADYGIVNNVNSDKTVDVVHSALPVLINGTVLEQTITKHVELLNIASSQIGLIVPPKNGDLVLLIGLKNYVKTVKGLQAPTQAPQEFLHYTQNTMKAIPLGIIESPKVKLVIDDNGKFTIQNTNSGQNIEITTAGSGSFKVNGNLEVLV